MTGWLGGYFVVPFVFWERTRVKTLGEQNPIDGAEINNYSNKRTK
jgi:hypothetical protein